MLVDINLLPEKEKARSMLLIAALAILGAAVLLCLVLFMLSNKLAKETATLDGQLIVLQQSQEEIRSGLQQSESGDEKKLLALTVDWAEAYQFDTVPLLHELINLLPERGFFQTFNFTGPNLATVVVQFDTKPDSAYYYTRLKSSQSIAEIHLDSVKVNNNESNEETELVNDVLPRYLATYSILFTDQRIAAEGTAGVDGAQNSDEGDGTGD
jgi:type IV pilus assembly protein PilN